MCPTIELNTHHFHLPSSTASLLCSPLTGVKSLTLQLLSSNARRYIYIYNFFFKVALKFQTFSCLESSHEPDSITSGSCHKYQFFLATKVCLPRQNFCRDKIILVAPNTCSSQQITSFVATKVCMSRQTRVFCDKYLQRQT